MDFFEAQQQAKQRTGLLIALFALAVLVLVLLTNALVLGVTGGIHAEPASWPWWQRIDWIRAAWVSAGVVTVVGLGSLFKLNQLSGGGKVVAEAMGGKLIPGGTDDLALKRLINIVEEMAIASGTPVPPVYLLEQEPGINAFAAGFSPHDAVIGVTAGIVRELNRDQLQGVIAHEFSHILNGDMRLNLRIIGVVHGIQVIGLLGQRLLRGMAFGAMGYGYGHRRRSGQGSGMLPIMALAMGLMVLGYAGTFFGHLIKAAVSRQREFLADAAAVQFTRNPGGIAGALKRIGGIDAGSEIKNPAAPELSHAFFGAGVTPMFTFLLATHPPLAERIKRLDRNWDGQFDTRPPMPAPEPEPERIKGEQRLGKLLTLGTGVSAIGAVARVGNPGAEHLEQARHILAAIPTPLRQAATEPYGARALIYALISAPDPHSQAERLAHLDDHADTGVADLTRNLLAPVTDLPQGLRLPLIDLCLPALGALSDPQHRLFVDNLKVLIALDGRMSLFEWSLETLLMRHLGRARDGHPQGAKTVAIHRMQPACGVLLSVLAFSGKADRAGAEAAFAAGQRHLQLPGVTLMAASQVTLGDFNDAVEDLANLQPLHKRRLFKALAAAVAADGVIQPVEAELLRAVAEALDLPVPPLLPDQPDL